MDIALDPATGDLDVVSGDLHILDGIDSIEQHVAIRLQFFQGEWFLDQRVGVPYFQDILVKNPNLDVVRFLLRNTVSTTPGITGLTSFALDFDGLTRTLGVEFEADTEEGPLEFDRELIL